MNPVYKSYDDKFVAYYPVYVNNPNNASEDDIIEDVPVCRAFADADCTIPMTMEELTKAYFIGCKVTSRGSNITEDVLAITNLPNSVMLLAMGALGTPYTVYAGERPNTLRPD